MGKDIVIELNRISFRYPSGRQVFAELDFILSKGERVGITGPNGSGKTTLLHIIMGLLKPDMGEVKIFGKPRRTEEEFKEVRLKIGLLFQDPDDQLFCPTVVEDVAFGPLNLRKTQEEAHRIAQRTLKELGLEGFEERITYTLSGGEKRLASLATVLAMEPKVLLLDEPTAGLDEETTERIIEVLTLSDLSYIVVTHDMEVLKRTTDCIYRLNDGKLHHL